MTSPPEPTDGSATDHQDAVLWRWWALAGVLTGLAGLLVSQLVSELLSVKDTPLLAVVGFVAQLRPGVLAQATAEFLITLARPLVLVLAAALVIGLFALGGLLWRRSPWAGLPLWGALAGAALAAGFATNGLSWVQLLPVVAALVTWLSLMAWLATRIRGHERRLARFRADEPDATTEQERAGLARSRRHVVLGMSTAVVIALTSGTGSVLLERRRAAVRGSRRLLRIPGVSRPRTPPGAALSLEGLTPWQTPNDVFHRTTYGLRTPTVEVSAWRLRIHGLVRTPLVLTYDQLLARGLDESWVTTVDVTNEVGGDRIGNAWWSGVLTRTLLAEAGVLDSADAVLQTAVDGWSCLTPLETLTDRRDALLAVAMNGEALPLEHGFPVRSVVPGVYDHVGTCRWVVDWEVTRSDRATSWASEQGYAEDAPIRPGSRIDLPGAGGTVEAGEVALGGMAWHPCVGVEGVEFAVDGGRWRQAEVSSPSTDQTWVQWGGRVPLEPGPHAVRVRAINRRGDVQTAVRRDPLPSGVSGLHEVEFEVAEPDEA